MAEHGRKLEEIRAEIEERTGKKHVRKGEGLPVVEREEELEEE